MYFHFVEPEIQQFEKNTFASRAISLYVIDLLLHRLSSSISVLVDLQAKISFVNAPLTWCQQHNLSSCNQVLVILRRLEKQITSGDFHCQGRKTIFCPEWANRKNVLAQFIWGRIQPYHLAKGACVASIPNKYLSNFYGLEVWDICSSF